MAVYSMTGFATAHATPQGDAVSPGTGGALGLEIRSVNSRFLDLVFKLPEELRGTEPALRELLSGGLKRGKVELRAWTENRSDQPLRPPGVGELQRLVGVQDAIRAWLPTAAPLSVAEVMHLTGRQAAAPGNQHEPLMELANQALEGLRQARAREGERLAAMLTDRLDQLRTLSREAAPLIPQLVALQRQRFLDRWNEALGAEAATVGATEQARDRALSEATAYAIRIDVAEELTRLGSHLEEIERLIRKGGEIGKRLDFLIQELHREANTLGSKSSSIELTRISVDMKVLIEQMREQVQNIE
jgi:uncharacterized protein (TIGR00255 family)